MKTMILGFLSGLATVLFVGGSALAQNFGGTVYFDIPQITLGVIAFGQGGNANLWISDRNNNFGLIDGYANSPAGYSYLRFNPVGSAYAYTPSNGSANDRASAEVNFGGSGGASYHFYNDAGNGEAYSSHSVNVGVRSYSSGNGNSGASININSDANSSTQRPSDKDGKG